MSEAAKPLQTVSNQATDHHAELRQLSRKGDTSAPRLWTMLIFVGLGPVIGSLVFFMPMLWHLATTLAAGFPDNVHDAPKAIAVFLMGAYLFGGIPAFLAGAGVFMARRILPRHPILRLLAFGFIGALATGVFAALLHFVFQQTRDDGTIVITPYFQNLGEFLILAATCIVPTLICGYIALRAGWLTPQPAAKDLAN